MICKGVTTKGKPCCKEASSNEYCLWHKNQEVKFTCGICYTGGEERKFSCSHSLCTSCVKCLTSLVCPFCRVDISSSLTSEELSIVTTNAEQRRQDVSEEDREYARVLDWRETKAGVEKEIIDISLTWLEMLLDDRKDIKRWKMRQGLNYMKRMREKYRDE
jgi:hypothetical protein